MSRRRVGRLLPFEKPADYAAFEKILAGAQAQTRIRIALYCLMPNHRHTPDEANPHLVSDFFGAYHLALLPN